MPCVPCARNSEGTGAPALYRRHGAEEYPLVSICIPAFNHGEFVEEAVNSALAQTYERLEVVVADDRSADGSYERLTRIRDPRLRLHRNERRLGHAPNRNRAVALARGELIKFLDDDDRLDPTCVTEMTDLFARDRSVGLVFCSREILMEDDGARGAEWLERYSTLHKRFTKLEEVSDGRDLFRMWLDEDGLRANWIGEPSAVMVSRLLLQRIGGFSPHVHQVMDSDLWCRMLPHTKVGFVDRPLASYRFGHAAATTVNNTTGNGWLDRLWMLEQLNEDREVASAYPQIATMLNAERRQAWRTFVKVGRAPDGVRVPAERYLPYARHRFRSLFGPQGQRLATMG